MSSTNDEHLDSVECPTTEHRDSWSSSASLDPIASSLLTLRADLLQRESIAASSLDRIPEAYRDSARNLVHYVALRSRDIRPLQELLVQKGLSSLGRCEAFVLANLETVLRQHLGAAVAGVELLSPSAIPCDFSRGHALLDRNIRRLFAGPVNRPQIMVTMPAQAATEYSIVRDLLAAGMSVMRINCAHDAPDQWLGMIQHLRKAQKELGRTCRVAMDLGGPKIRTASMGQGPTVMSWKPKRDTFGRIRSPISIRLSPAGRADMPNGADVVLPVRDRWWQSAIVGDVLKFEDTAGRPREMKVLESGDEGLLCQTSRSAYVDHNTVFRVLRSTASTDKRELVTSGHVGPIPPKTMSVRVSRGDLLRITGPETSPSAEHAPPRDLPPAPIVISCTLPEVFRDAEPGHRVLLDDGKITGEIMEASEQELLVKITRAKVGGQRLREDKGINLPDTELNLPALTSKDLEDLEFVAEHADLVNYSFVRRREDIRMLKERLSALGRPDMGVIIKVENRQAFDNLPLLLLELMSGTSAGGVMIARGDLAVECGWERLAELQEEILWVCEAAHIPVVWATQVLEGLAKQGLPTRAEVTDAGMSSRAECVMLNKGPNIVETVESLHDILRRMKQHQEKKRATFRRLSMTDAFLRHFNRQA